MTARNYQSYGDVEDKTLHKSLEITNALIAVHVTSQTLYTEITNAVSSWLVVCMFALCNCSRTHTDKLT